MNETIFIYQLVLFAPEWFFCTEAGGDGPLGDALSVLRLMGKEFSFGM